MMRNLFSIDIRHERTYFGGDIIEGSLELDVKDTFKMRNIKLELQGIECMKLKRVSK